MDEGNNNEGEAQSNTIENSIKNNEKKNQDIKEGNNKGNNENANNGKISVIMEDENQNSYSFICQISDKFLSLEKKLFKKNPSLENKKLNYLINNKKIDISKTLEENNITDGSIIYYKIQESNNEDDEISVIIKSLDQNIKCPFICKKSEKFKELEQKIYEKYPDLKNKEHFYLCSGKVIDIEKTIEENKIKDNDIILINEIEEDEENNNDLFDLVLL